jgi:hypothetical protein
MQPALGIDWWRQDGRIAARLRPPSDLPVSVLVRGRPAGEVADLLPRLFSICREAQGLAVRLALGLPAGPGAEAAVQAEVRRDHLLKLCLHWPALLGLPVPGLPRGGPAGDPGPHLLGDRALPEDGAALEAWIGSGEGAAPLFAALYRAFAPGEAVADLPLVSAATALEAEARENSAAARQAGHPFLRAVEAARGRGPLWRAAACLVECVQDVLPAPVVLPDGTAVVPAARGLYAVRALADRGRVSALSRRTPTDHLTAPGGALEQALAALPAGKAALIPLMVDILSPCLPVSIREVQGA